ncbi:GDSL esterase/lipase At2g03980-like [Vigna radiata var. radiata]|uniref:GDSL esterase/lipase At2g03980-like n=1 Tax=Vigna radiata var. radiata TaxID=3916 RepID=A0A3Q0EMW9_VIGRR|nr:GDSL esterase/lipase At2g03980-like [Vigna radiata var. radiata]
MITYQLAFLVNVSHSKKKIVPVLYVFGDSTVDAGNNNNLNTLAKANAFPYGIDFNNCSTGRFSNGKTFADLVAIKLGLPMPPSYLGVPKSERHQVVTGINYASGSCGILNSTRSYPNGTNNNLNPEKYADYLLEQLASLIKKIYDLGARKFVKSRVSSGIVAGEV